MGVAGQRIPSEIDLTKPWDLSLPLKFMSQTLSFNPDLCQSVQSVVPLFFPKSESGI